MLLLHAFLFFVLTSSTVVSEPDTRHLAIKDFPHYGQWYRVPSTLADCARFLHPSALSWNDNLYRNDVMNPLPRTIDFGRLDTILGRRAMMPGDTLPTYPYPIIPHAHESRGRVFGTWRRFPSNGVSPASRLVELVIWPGEQDTAVWIQVMQAQVIIPTSHNSVSSVLTGIFRSKEFSPPDITGAFYRVSSENPNYQSDVIVFKPGHSPTLFLLSSSGNIVYYEDHIPPKRFVGAWCRWPNSDHSHDLLAFWLDQGTLKYATNPAVTKRKIGEAKMHEIIEAAPPPYDNSHH